jgi:uncharacterized membrane protein
MQTAVEPSRAFVILSRKARSNNQASTAAGRASMFINGGASLALLAVFALIWGKPSVPPTVAVGIATAVLYFALGLLLSAMTSGVAFMNQRWVQEQADGGDLVRAERVFRIMNAVSTALIVGAWALFLLGTLITYKCFSMSPWFAGEF